MAKSTHTPGPWKQFSVYPATVWAGSEDEPRIISDRAGCDPEDVANARLIAAAPDLLEAIKPLAFSADDLPPHGVDVSDWRGAVHAARAALSKARG